MDDEDPTVTIARLREQITQTRKDRMSAQRTVATSGVLEVALKRTSRDRSSGATGETDALREEIAELRDSIVHEVRQVDRTRTLFSPRRRGVARPPATRARGCRAQSRSPVAH